MPALARHHAGYRHARPASPPPTPDLPTAISRLSTPGALRLHQAVPGPAHTQAQAAAYKPTAEEAEGAAPVSSPVAHTRTPSHPPAP